MISLQKSDLIFMSRLSLEIEIFALKKSEGSCFWILKIVTNNAGIKQEGILHGARGEVRKFQQLNALVKCCESYLPKVKKIHVHL